MDLQKTIDQALPKLRPHLSLLLGSFLLFNLVHLVVVPLIGHTFYGAQWKSLNARTRNNWSVLLCAVARKTTQPLCIRAIRVCSQIHALIILPLALRCLWLPELDADRAFGWHERSGTVQAVACG